MALSLRKLGKKITDIAGGVERQVNPFDNNRTYKQQDPTNTRSVIGQATHSGLSNAVGNFVVKPIAQQATQFGVDASSQLYNRVVAPTLNLPKQNLQTGTALNPLVDRLKNASGATGTLGQTASSGVLTGLNIAAPGSSKVLTKGIERVLPTAAPIVPKVLSGAAVGSQVGGVGNTASYLGSNQRLTLGGAAKAYGQGAATGALVGGTIPAVKPTVTALNNNRIPLNQVGSVGKGKPVVRPKAQEPIVAYHGSTNNKLTSLVPGVKTGLNEKRNLVYLTEDKKTAGDYTKARGDGGLGVLKDSPTGKVYPVQVNGKVLDAYDRTALDNLKSAPGYEQLSGKTKNHITNDTGLSPDILEANPELTNFLNQNGVTAVRAHLPNGGGAMQLAVINHKNIKLAETTPLPRLKISKKSPATSVEPLVTAKGKGSAEASLRKIMQSENLSREAATKRMDQMLRDSVAPGQTLSGVPEGAPIAITGNVVKNQAVSDTLKALSKAQREANVERSITSAAIERAAKDTGVNPGDVGLIERYQTGTITDPKEAAFAARVKAETDRIFQNQQAISPDIRYRQNYLPGAYRQDQAEIDDAIRQFRSRTGNDQAKQFQSYGEAAGFGLAPRYSNIQDLLGTNAAQARQALSTRQAVENGLKEGIFSVAPKDRNWRQVEGLRAPNGEPLFAHGEVANRFNSTFQKPDEALGKALQKVATGSKAVQETALTGGIPNSYFNAFGIAQANTQAFGYLRPSVIKDLFYATNKGSTQKRFTREKSAAPGLSTPDFVRAVVAKGGNINPVRSSAGNVGSSTLRKFGNVASGQEATFEQLVPNFQLSIAEATYKKYANRGHDAALQIAADTVNRATGFVDELGKGRSTNVRNATSAAFFAPKYREAVVNQLANAIKGWAPKNLKDPSYRYSRRFAGGLLATAALYDAANVHATGHHMWENRKGQELSLEIPNGPKDAKGNQAVINIPLFPSTLTVPRAVVNGVIAGVRGDTKGVASEGSKFLSTPLQVGGQIASNKDYFSRPIVNDATVAQNEGVAEDSTAQKAKKVGVYGAKQLTPGWVRAGIDKAGGKPTAQVAAQAFEAPVRFGKQINPETTAYFGALDKAKKTLNKNEQAAYDSLHPKKKNTAGNQIYEADSIYNPAARLDIYNRFPKVFQADKTLNDDQAKRGNPSNPLFGLDSWQVKKVLEKDNLPPGASDKELSKLYGQPWYQDYQTKKSAYFSEVGKKLSSQGQSLSKSDNPYPATPPALQKTMDYYSSLPKGTGARSAWIKANPGQWNAMTDQFAKIDNWQNLQRGKRGLDTTEGDAGVAAGYGDGSSKYGSKGSGVGSVYKYAISRNTGGKVSGPKVSIKQAKLGKAKVAKVALKKAKVTTKKSLV